MCQWRHYQLTVDTFKLSWYFTWFNFNFLICAEVLVLRYIKTVGLIGKLIKSLHYSFIYFNSTHSANGVIGGNGWYVELWDHCGVNSIHQSTFKYVEIIFLFFTKNFLFSILMFRLINFCYKLWNLFIFLLGELRSTLYTPLFKSP